MDINPSWLKEDDYPVEHVSWDDVQAYITKMNQMGEEIHRLPAEAQWEYACGAGMMRSICGASM